MAVGSTTSIWARKTSCSPWSMTASSIASTRRYSLMTSSGPRISMSLAGRGSGWSKRTVQRTYCADSTAPGARSCGQIAILREIAICQQFRRGLRESLDDHRHALAAADAHRLQTERLVLCRKVVQQRGGDTRTRHTERVTQRDRPAGHVELVQIHAQLASRTEHLYRERLVDLVQVDVVDRHARVRQRLTRGLDGAQAHDLRRKPRHARRDDARQGCQAQFS